MCGRICVAAKAEEILWQFGIEGQLPGLHAMPARYNIAPTQPILTILGNEQARQARLMKWAFLPDWVKDPKEFSLINNARAETIEEKPSFRNAIRQRRCLIPVSGFYEWNRTGKDGAKQPYWISAPSTSLMALAGIWETWMGPNGEEVDTTAIVTTKANKVMAKVHHRMPVIIHPSEFSTWLDTLSGRADDIRPLMRPAPEDLLSIIPISDRVNRVANDDPALIEPVQLATDIREESNTGSENEEQAKADTDQLSLF